MSGPRLRECRAKAIQPLFRTAIFRASLAQASTKISVAPQDEIRAIARPDLRAWEESALFVIDSYRMNFIR
jgi:hypothetical protein